ncbi:MAG: hypothetical protein KTR18_13350 [Acidiferrobacterales bacterium]|nr:hypothetical protein [Acidiferrobacterales bacterium]
MPNINKLLNVLKFTTAGFEMVFDCGLTLEDKSIWSSTVTPGGIGFLGENPILGVTSAQLA